MEILITSFVGVGVVEGKGVLNSDSSVWSSLKMLISILTNLLRTTIMMMKTTAKVQRGKSPRTKSTNYNVSYFW